MTNNGKDLDKILSGSKGIVYLMFAGRGAKTSDVVKIIHDNGIVQDFNSIYGSINKLEKNKPSLVYTVKVLEKPGPPKIRTANLQPIFDTVSFYRIWKISAGKDERQLTEKEKAQLKSLFKSVACFLEYFPEYFSWGIKALRKRSVRNVEWHDTLHIFFQFCEKLIEVCWEIKHHKFQLNSHYLKWHSVIEREEIHPYFLALEHLSKDPYIYVYNAYKQKKITDQHVLALANLSQKGHKDIYLNGTLLQELHFTSLALRDPISASQFLYNIEEIEETLWEDRLREINVRALDWAIHNKAREESQRITQMMIKKMQEVINVKELAKKIAMHEAAEQFRREAYSFEESDVNQALRMIIKIVNMDMTEEELRRVLVNLNVRRALQMYLDKLDRDSYIKLKDGKIIRLKWEKKA